MSTALSTINSLVNDRRRDTTNLSVDMTAEGFRAINGTLQLWNQFHDWPWQMEKTIFNYNPGITTFNIASTLNFKAIINIRPQRQFEKWNELYYVSSNIFDSDTIHAKRMAVRTEGQANYLRMQYTGWMQIINTMNSTTANGTWVGASAISNVATDLYNFFEQSASLSFDYSGTSGTLTNSTMTAMDLSRYKGRSVFALNLNLQTITQFTGLTLKIGSDASNYITMSATTDYLGNTAALGWNKFTFAWSGTTTVVGTPVYTAMTYAQVTMSYSGSQTTVRNNIENLFVSENVPMTMDYYSNNMVIQASDSVKYQIFQNASNTTDTTMWSGIWDYVNETFTDSCMQIVSYLTGQISDEQVAQTRVKEYLEPLKARLPSKRRYPQYTIVPDLNGEYAGPWPTPYRQGWNGQP